MRTTEIESIINKNNKDNEVNWEITKNTRSKIILTINNYCKSKDVEFTISIKKEKNGNKYIEITDKRYGMKIWDDFKSEKESLTKFIKSAIKMFYIYYY